MTRRTELRQLRNAAEDFEQEARALIVEALAAPMASMRKIKRYEKLLKGDASLSAILLHNATTASMQSLLRLGYAQARLDDANRIRAMLPRRH